ncbi:hypothetical protein ABEG17_02435 [Pedococcus sp. KACC 23699]|uniref:Uncharacterized protein n=1 Tax=Pedococcus sp. KACC 23699 TaxID=3149228 RepID=A0AAU7JVA9_9MICO
MVRITANNGAESLNVTATELGSGVYWGGRAQRVYEPEARILFVVRESSLSALQQLANMAATVLGAHSYRDDLQDLINGGVAPLFEPQSWGGYPIKVPEGRVAVVRRGNSYVLYALTSAAKDSDQGDNAFTRALAQTLRDLKPDVLVTGPVSRIVRHEHHVSDAARALKAARVLLDCAATEVIDFKHNPSAGADFIALATHAIRERSVIVARMDGGRLAGASRGRYPFAEATLPLGYVRTPDGRIALADKAVVEALQRAFEQLAHSTTSRGQVAATLAAAKVLTTRKAGLVSQRRLVDLKLSKAYVKRMIERIDTYERGQHQVNHRTQVPRLVGDRGALDPQIEYVFDLPVPEGGWASPEVFSAIRERSREAQAKRNRLPQTTPDKNRQQLPLAGFRWRVGEEEFALLSRSYRSRSHYMLAVRKASSAALGAEPGGRAWTASLKRGWTEATPNSPHFRCLVVPADFHKSIADAVGQLRRFEFVEPAGLLSHAGRAPDSDTSEDECSALADELTRATRIKKQAHDEFYATSPGDSLRPVFKADYEEASDSVARLTRLLERAKTRPPAPKPPEALRVSVGDFMMALARLRHTQGMLPLPIVEALHAVFTGFTVNYDQRQGTANWSLALRLPTAGGTGEKQTAPVTGAVAIAPRRSQKSLAHEVADALRRAAEPTPLDPDLSAYAIRGLKGVGVAGHGAAQSLVGAPAQVRSIAIRELLGEPPSEGVDPGFRTLLVSAYTGESTTAQFNWNAPSALRQDLLDVVSQEGALDREELARRFETQLLGRDLDALLRAKDGTWLGVAQLDRYFVAPSNKGGQKVSVQCRDCPHCGGRVDIVARVRECPLGLLCSGCLRMPVAGSPEFPDCFRSLAALPQARRPVKDAQPEWWLDLRRAVLGDPAITTTMLVSRLGKRRHEIHSAVEALELHVKTTGSIGPEWTDARLREAYIDRKTPLVDLAYTLGVSDRALSKRLHKAGISRYRQ